METTEALLSHGFAHEDLWRLEDPVRTETVKDLFRQCAEIFEAAEDADQEKHAQNAAHLGLLAIAGLFDDPSDPAHVLIAALTEMLVDARAGKRQSILLKPGAQLDGTKKGARHLELSAFAISAVEVVLAWDIATDLVAAQGKVASLLADLGCSLKTDSHGVPKPITFKAIADWMEKKELNILRQRYADRGFSNHTQNIITMDISEPAEVWDYLREQAAEVVRRYMKK